MSYLVTTTENHDKKIHMGIAWPLATPTLSCDTFMQAHPSIVAIAMSKQLCVLLESTKIWSCLPTTDPIMWIVYPPSDPAIAWSEITSFSWTLRCCCLVYCGSIFSSTSSIKKKYIAMMPQGKLFIAPRTKSLDTFILDLLTRENKS